MKKINFILLAAVLCMLTSCGVGVYYPYAHNVFGAQTTVHLDKANFRVVRDVEAVVAVTNTNLSRSSVEKSAYGQLLRNARLTGSQVLINVVIEEVQRASGGLFRWALGAPKIVQYVAARATIIEFLDEHGNPTVSESYRPTSVQTSTANSLSEATNTPISIIEPTNIERENAEQEYNILVGKLDKYGWQKSLLYSSYEKAFKYLIENNKIDDAKKVNRVLQDVFDNKIFKSNIEKQLKINAEKGIPEYQTFLQF